MSWPPKARKPSSSPVGDISSKRLQEEIQATGGPRPYPVAIDLADRDSPQKIKDEVFKKFGHVDIVVNNAGGSRPLSLDAPDEAWDESFAINFTAVRKLTQAFLPVMQDRRWVAS